MRVIKKELEPFLRKLEEEHVDFFSLTMFLASFVSELLEEIDDPKKKELILRKMLD